MTTRREIFQLAAQSAGAALLPGSQGAAVEQNEAHPASPRRGRPLFDLQQRFVDLRFGMFLRFNMATFQDREWGDPTSPPDLFDPTALDTDQWAAAARSANMTWGCLTTRHHDGFCIWPTKTRGASIGRTSHSSDVVHAKRWSPNDSVLVKLPESPSCRARITYCQHLKEDEFATGLQFSFSSGVNDPPLILHLGSQK